ncbi:MAG: type II toxin-antitoxin system HicB family antitoxin [Pseudomonadota bacterium]
MLYPVYIHQGDDRHAHGATIVDFPGCFTAVDDWSDIADSVQEAVEVYCEGEDMEIPTPTDLSALVELEEAGEYEGGTWAMIDINVDKLDTKKERVNLSISRSDLREIDDYAESKNIRRSPFMVAAALKEVRGG